MDNNKFSFDGYPADIRDINFVMSSAVHFDRSVLLFVFKIFGSTSCTGVWQYGICQISANEKIPFF
jgi:hypothetical protein